MVRNLYSVRGLPCQPGRVWRKRTGAPRVRRMLSAISNNLSLFHLQQVVQKSQEAFHISLVD
jgi:hypothetical protein